MAETLNISSSSDLQPLETSEKIPLVLLHGWGLNSAVWQPLIESLPDDFTQFFNVVTLDLPGFGVNVSVDITPYSLANICQSITNTITKPAIYVGWSLGGLVATEMALRFPEKVLALITVASTPRFIEEKVQVEENIQVIWPGIKANVLAAFHQQLQVNIEKTIDGFLKIQAMGSPHIRQDIKKISQLVFQQKMASQATLDQSLTLLESSDYRHTLQNVTQPFLRLYGNADSLVPKSVIEKVNELTPKSDVYIFKQASHAPFISHADDFKEILIQWLMVNLKNKAI
ncbi:pimeloyl-ACP methyl ester esterase BioH [Colwellia sp. E150_009]